MNIFTEKMASKSTNELVDILNQKEKYQKSAIIAVVEELKKRNYKEQDLDNIPFGFKLHEDTESLFGKLKSYGYELNTLKKNLIILTKKNLLGKEIYRFEKDKIYVGTKTFSNEDIIEYKRSEINDIIVDTEATLGSTTDIDFFSFCNIYVSLIMKNGDYVELFKIKDLASLVDEIEEYLKKLIEVLKMKN